jgi:hypothetical protein
MAHKNKKLVNWSDLTKFRKSIDIKFNGQTIFTIQEMESDVFNIFLENWITKLEDQENTFENDEIIVFALKNTIKGVDFEGFSDEEILSSFNSMSDEIKIQINEAFKELIIKPVEYRIKAFSKILDTFQGMDKDNVEKIIKKFTK